MAFILKTLFAAALISFCSWLSARKPQLAGFLIALPLTSIIVLLFSYIEHRDSQLTVNFAKSIFVGIPVSLLFFVPFLLAERWHLNFMTSFLWGLTFLVGGYFAHRHILGAL